MTCEWDAHTALTADDDGSHGAELDAGWVVGGGLIGLIGLIGRAIAATVPHPPVTFDHGAPGGRRPSS